MDSKRIEKKFDILPEYERPEGGWQGLEQDSPTVWSVSSLLHAGCRLRAMRFIAHRTMGFQ